MKVCFETFGCRLNRAEALEEEATYLDDGWELTQQHSEANLIIIRGCSVTSRAQRDCEKLIQHLKEKYPNTRLIVHGCITERIDPPKGALWVPPAKDLPAVPTRTARAYLKVQDGCTGKCTFCIVPKFRGAPVSEDFDFVLDKARRFIDAGYHEIVVTGCNLSLYASKGRRLPELLVALAQLGNCRIRLGSLEPGDCAPDTVKAIAETERICKFIHIPVQSGSNLILTAMRRPYTVKDIETLVGKAYELCPELGIGCDIITGFPGETDLDFIATKGLLKRLPFSNAHIFPYSERPGTLAADFGTKISHSVRSARAHELSDMMSIKRNQFAKRFIGKEVEVVIENASTLGGWTSQYLWFDAISTPTKRDESSRKQCLRFRVTETHHDKLRGISI